MSIIRSVVTRFVRDTVGDDRVGVPDQANSLADFGIDSLKATKLIVELEETFDVTFLEADLEFDNVKSIAAIHSLLGKYLDDRSGSLGGLWT